MSEGCTDCEWMRRDNQMRNRCYSPQLLAWEATGILCVFETDDYVEAGRSHADGTGKCGPTLLNKKKRVGQ